VELLVEIFVAALLLLQEVALMQVVLKFQHVVGFEIELSLLQSKSFISLIHLNVAIQEHVVDSLHFAVQVVA